ncbi:MAG: histidine kinase [Rhodospirillaceae bacterium]|nr:MAG: histidine kinase [Rhodospirillaceae bacterium]
MFVKTIIEDKQHGLITIDPTATIKDVAQMFKREQIGFALVQDENKKLIGTISERDIIHTLSERVDLSDVLVAEVLTINVVTCDISDTLDTVRDIMAAKRTRHVLVMDKTTLVGIVSIGDLVKHSLNECRVDTIEMVDYINGQGYH